MRLDSPAAAYTVVVLMLLALAGVLLGVDAVDGRGGINYGLALTGLALSLLALPWSTPVLLYDGALGGPNGPWVFAVGGCVANIIVMHLAGKRRRRRRV